MKKIFKIIILILVISVIVILFLIFDFGRKNTDFFINNNSAIETLIKVNIIDNQIVSNPIKIEGEVIGSWFFEGSFPIKLVSTNNEILGNSLATTSKNWMTNDFISFTSELNYTKSTSTNRALLILSKDNPSGNKELDQEIYIPVIIK